MHFNYKIISILVLASAFIYSCGKMDAHEASYQLEQNGCDTGKHKFTSKNSQEDADSQMCQGLLNNSLNNNCAMDLRKDYFLSHCSGKAWEPY